MPEAPGTLEGCYALLAFHAGSSTPHQPRELLIEMLWPETEPEAGRHNLSNALSFLRHVLEPPGVPPGTVILADRAAIRLNPARAAVKLVVTSRQKLRIEGEHEFRLSPLPTSGTGQIPEAMLGTAGIALFVDRAQAARSDFQLTERNAAAVGQLCDRLEGLPLAIELAAARVSVLSPARILEQVSADRLDFLATRRRDASSRQRTLRATLDWSYQLLPAAGRQFLAELSVFRGGCTLEAARAVCETDEENDVLELLTQLRDSSLITAVDEEDGLRFHLLETVREYAAEQLERSGVQEGVQRRHASYFRELAEASTPHLRGPHQAALIRRLEREHDNFRAALGWARAAGEDELRADLGCSLRPFWMLEGYAEEARQWVEELRGKEKSLSPRCRARLLNHLGILASNRGDTEDGIALQRRSLALYRELGDTAQIARVLGTLGQDVRDRDPALARGYLEEGLTLAREAGDEPNVSRILLFLASSLFRGGEQGRARALLTEARALCRGRGDLHGLADLLVEEGAHARDCGDREHARACFEENLALRRQIEDRPGIGFALYYLGYLALLDSRFTDAARDGEGALAAFHASQWDHTSTAADLMLMLVKARRSLGNHEETETLARQSLRIYQDTHHTGWSHACLFFLADAAARRSEPVRAARLLGIRAALGVPLDEPEPEELAHLRASLIEEAAQLRASLIAELGADRFAQEELIGQTLPADEAMALALGD